MLYTIAFALLATSADVGHRCEFDRASLPPMPGLLRFVSGTAALVAIGLLVYGFWIAWYAPLLALVAFLVVTWMRLTVLSRFVVEWPTYSILSGLGGAAATFAVFLS